MGRYFKFPMDLKLKKTPELNDTNHSALYGYLRDVSIASTFAATVLRVLVEERRTAHRNRWNTKRAAKTFQIGDVIKAHVQAQSNTTTGTVHKLSYQARGLFQIKEILEANSCIEQRYDNDKSATRKYKGSESYLFPPSIFPHNPVDTMDQQCLKFSHTPVVSPPKQPLKIELYNNIYFPSHSKHTCKPSVNKLSCELDTVTFQEHACESTIASAATLFEAIKTVPPLK